MFDCLQRDFLLTNKTLFSDLQYYISHNKYPITHKALITRNKIYSRSFYFKLLRCIVVCLLKKNVLSHLFTILHFYTPRKHHNVKFSEFSGGLEIQPWQEKLKWYMRIRKITWESFNTKLNFLFSRIFWTPLNNSSCPRVFCNYTFI